MRKMLRAGDDPRDFEDEVEESDIDVIELMKDQGIPMGEQVKKKGMPLVHAFNSGRFPSRPLQRQESLGKIP